MAWHSDAIATRSDFSFDLLLEPVVFFYRGAAALRMSFTCRTYCRISFVWHGTLGGPLLAAPCPAVRRAHLHQCRRGSRCDGQTSQRWSPSVGRSAASPVASRIRRLRLARESLASLREACTVMAGVFNCCALGEGHLSLHDGSLQLDISAKSDVIGTEFSDTTTVVAVGHARIQTRGGSLQLLSRTDRELVNTPAPRQWRPCRLHRAGPLPRPPAGSRPDRGQHLPTSFRTQAKHYRMACC